MKNHRTVALTIAAVAIAATSLAQPRFTPIPESTLLGGSPLHVPLDGIGPSGEALTYTAVVSDPLVTATVFSGNRSLRIQVATYGTMVFQLFDGRVARATNHIATLADSGFYNGVIFHRIINDFVVQGGDPTGTGAGGSPLGDFDDKFHVDLQHNRSGLLSMAKAADDTNDSQFFITDSAQRQLDFNHSIFGLLVEGDAVREQISAVDVDGNDRPVVDVVMESVSTFVDTQNAVLMLKAPEGATGAVDVAVTVENADGASTTQTFRVNVTPDTVNSAPFLADIPEITTPIDTQVTYQLVAIDAEGDASSFLDQNTMVANGLPVPVQAPLTLQYTVDFDTGLLTVLPSGGGGISGPQRISVATAVSANAVDYQVVSVVVGGVPADPSSP